MTKEQIEACEKLAYKPYGFEGTSRREFGFFIRGFQAAQTPEMLLLNPLVKGLVDALSRAKWCGYCENHRYIEEPESFNNAYGEHGLEEIECSCVGGISRALAPFKEGDDG